MRRLNATNYLRLLTQPGRRVGCFQHRNTHKLNQEGNALRRVRTKRRRPSLLNRTNSGLRGNWSAYSCCTNATGLWLAAIQHDSAMSSNSSPAVGACLTLKEVAARLQVCRRTLEREIQAGRFPRPLKIGRSVRVLESDLQAYFARLRGEAPLSHAP